MFLNEFDLLEIRLHHLAPFVRKFVLCEAAITHSGKAKPLFFQEYKEQYPDEYAARFGKFEITHLIADDGMTPRQTVGKYVDESDAWRREHYQREFLWNGFDDVADTETILISDLDEIPDLADYCVEGMEGFFHQKLYYFYVNLYADRESWRGTMAVQKQHIVPFDVSEPSGPTITTMKQGRSRAPAVDPAGIGGKGWHFSTLGTQEDIVYKFQSIAHTELDNPKNIEQTLVCRQYLHNPYQFAWHRKRLLLVEMPTGPTYLLENQERFRHFFYDPTLQSTDGQNVSAAQT